MTSPLPPPLPVLISTYGAHLSALQQSSDMLSNTADSWERDFGSQQQQVTQLNWIGEGPTAANETVTSQNSVVSQQADQLRRVTQVQQQAIPELQGEFDQVKQKIDSIQQDGFEVTPDYGVVDTKQSGDVETMLQREAQAQAHAAELHTQVGKFWQAELAASSRLQALADVHKFSLSDPGPPCPNGERWSPENHQCEPGELGPFSGLTPQTVPGLPPVPPGGDVQQGLIDGRRQGLPVLAPSFYTPTGGNGHVQMVDRSFKQDISSPNPWTGPGGVWAAPTGEYPNPPAPVRPLPTIPKPPVMTAMKPEDSWPLDTPNYIPQVPSPGGMIAGAINGCVGGMGGLTALSAAVPPLEGIAPEAGCAAGVVLGAGGAVMAPLFNNSLHGVDLPSSIDYWETDWGDRILGGPDGR